MPLLEIEDLRTGYGAVPVLHGVNMNVEEGETAVLLGLNGAGKTTTLISISGLLRPWAGRISFNGEPIHGKDATEMVQKGIVLSPEGRRVFPALSVYNNMKLGAWPIRRDLKRLKENADLVFDVFPRLQERRDQLAGTLSGGEQQMLAIGRAMMAAPRLLLVDEASLGLSPVLAQEVFQAMARVNKLGTTVIIVEQNAGVLKIAHRAFIMLKGEIVYEGTGDELRKGGELRKAYLGAPA
jgi:branched-chain amino acid transport system ATP-binding protein